jgi:uncharacterized protein
MGHQSADGCGCGLISAVPLFPLPNVVLFPKAVLPLHIFEERYKAMTADALAGDRRIAMALLKTGWERNYYCRPAIEPVVCVGTIVSHERLADGKYNFLLQGMTRATIIEETQGHAPYRVAHLRPLDSPPVMEIDLCNERLELLSIFSRSAFSQVPLSRQFQQMLNSHLPTSDIVDLIAFNLLESVCLKQKLLAQPDPRQRAQRVICALQAMQPSISGAESAVDISRN